MTRKARSLLQAVGFGLFLGVLITSVIAGPPYTPFAYVAAGIGALLWLVMTVLADRQAREPQRQPDYEVVS